MIRTVLIDDEKHFLLTLKSILNSQVDIEIVGEARGVESGLKVIREMKPELVFLDVEMEDGTGFDLLGRFPSIDFQVIFVTAHDQYAINAFKFSALDYLLKPLISTELFSALDKARHNLRSNKINIQLNVLLENITKISKPNKTIILKETDVIHVVQLEEILWCTAEGSYCTFFLTDERRITVSHNLKEYEELLSPNGFFRIHRSHLVNLSKIKRFNKADGGTILLDGNRSLPVSLRKKEQLTKLLSSI